MVMLETREVVFAPSRWMSTSLAQLNDIVFVVDVVWHDLAALGVVSLAIVAVVDLNVFGSCLGMVEELLGGWEFIVGDGECQGLLLCSGVTCSHGVVVGSEVGEVCHGSARKAAVMLSVDAGDELGSTSHVQISCVMGSQLELNAIGSKFQ